MKTLTSLKITSAVQALYCIYCLLSTLLIIVGVRIGPVILANVMLIIFYSTVEFSIFIMPACFVVNLVFFIIERQYPQQRAILGKKWIWIFVWPVIVTVFFLILIVPFIRGSFFK